jgi:hypothetical protein
VSEKPREVGRLLLPRPARNWASGGGSRKPRRQEATLRLCVAGGEVHVSIGYDEVALDVEARDQFARMWMEAERQAEAQAGAKP